MTRRLSSVVILALALVTAIWTIGYNGDEPVSVTQEQAKEASVPSAASFQSAFDAGADCATLFAIRNAVKTAAATEHIEAMNKKLRSVQCFNADAKRREQTSNDGAFTIEEYRIYRAVVDTPLSIPEDQVMRDVAKRHGVTSASTKATTEKVMALLSKGGWLVPPEEAIRHASDWNGEKQ